jgi:hypothetical protein
MDSKMILVVVIGVIAVMIVRSDAINCYSCISVNSTNCLDPFKADGIRTCQGAACVKGKGTESGVTVVIRDCLPEPVQKDECAEVKKTRFKGFACVCRSDKCNDGQIVKPTKFNVFIGVAMVAVMLITWLK